MKPWQKLPHDIMESILKQELQAPHIYRPEYTWFRSFARRSGSFLRFLLLATLSNRDVTAHDILHYDEDDGWDGLYTDEAPFANEDVLVVDPMMGSGNTIFEGTRLGVDVAGFEYNPVLWWKVHQTARSTEIDLELAFNDFLENARAELGPLFGSNSGETVLAYLLALHIECSDCGHPIELHADYRVSSRNRDTDVYLCPTAACPDRIIHTDTASEFIECPSCDTQFSPSDGNYIRGRYTCDYCGFQESLQDYFDARDTQPHFKRYAVYNERDGNREYRKLTESDSTALDIARDRYQEEATELPLPGANIRAGKTTNHLLQYNYTQYRDIYTKRQQLVIGRLLQRASEHPDQEISELLISLIISTLEYNNTLTQWNRFHDSVDSAFQINQTILQVETVEANPLVGGSRASLVSAHDRLRNAKERLETPSERLVTPSGDSEVIQLPGEGLDTDRIQELSVGSADRLSVETDSVDCIIVDPPAYDNVQYGELLDFYHVWLHQILGEDYTEFSSEHAPQLREIIINHEQEKDEEYYRNALRNAFEELNRILSSNGTLVTLFPMLHDRAWEDISSILISSRFTIHGATLLRTNNGDDPRRSLEGTIVIFASKTSADGETTLGRLRQNLLYEIDAMFRDERENQPTLSKPALRVVLKTRCLEEFSRYYPQVYDGGEQVSIEQAFQMVETVIVDAL